LNSTDYDGDQYNFIILNDNLLADQFEVYSPYYTIPTLNSPFDISGSLSMQGPANTILMEYLKDKEDSGSNDFWTEYLNI